MGSCCCNHNVHNHLWFLISLLLLSTRQMALLAEGRGTPKLLQVSQREGGKEVVVRAMIGSRPPSCTRRCTSCAHCEAIQVPAMPKIKNTPTHFFSRSTTFRVFDDDSNYKPLSWKCKCGNVIYNP